MRPEKYIIYIHIYYVLHNIGSPAPKGSVITDRGGAVAPPFTAVSIVGTAQHLYEVQAYVAVQVAILGDQVLHIALQHKHTVKMPVKALTPC